jgi:hypothetical protein
MKKIENIITAHNEGKGLKKNKKNKITGFLLLPPPVPGSRAG